MGWTADYTFEAMIDEMIELLDRKIMKLKIKHFDTKVFESKMQHLKDIDFTLFVDDIPQSESELTDLNFLVLQEPNEYFGLHDWAIENRTFIFRNINLG